MTFPVNPRLQAFARALRNGNTSVILDDASSPSSWTEYGTGVTLSAGTLELELDNSAVAFPRASSKFSPFCQDIKIGFDLSWAVSVTSTVNVAIGNDAIISSDGLTAANALIQLKLKSSGLVELIVRHGGLADYTNHSVTESEVPGRAELTLRRKSWNVVGYPIGSEWELVVYDSAGTTIQNTYTGEYEAAAGVPLDWELWNLATPNRDAIGDGHSGLLIKTWNNGNPGETVTFTDFSVDYMNPEQIGPTTWGPMRTGLNVNEHPDVEGEQTGYDIGYIDPSEAPFSADSTGAIECSDKLLDAAEEAKEHGYIVWLGKDNTYLVDQQLNVRAQLYRRDNATPSEHKPYGNKYATPVWQGSTLGRPTIKAVDGTWTGTATDSNCTPILLFDNWNREMDPPPTPFKPNAIYNSVIRELIFDLGNNPTLCGPQVWGAQGCEIQRIKVFGEDFYAGLLGLPGSGGLTTTVDIYGGQIAFLVQGSQPVPALTGCFVSGQQTNILKTTTARPSPASGNRCTLAVTGLWAEQFNGQVAFDLTDVWGYERGHVEISDTVIDWTNYNSSNWLVESNRSIVLQNVWVRNVERLIDSPNGNINVDNPTEWTHIAHAYIPYNNATASLPGKFQQVPVDPTPSPFNYNEGAIIDQAAPDNTNTVLYGSKNRVPEKTKIHVPSRMKSTYATLETGTNIKVAQSLAGDYSADDSVGINAAITAASPGDHLYLPRGIFKVADSVVQKAGVHVAGSSKSGTHVTNVNNPGANDPFGANDSPRPIWDTEDSSVETWLGSMNLHHTPTTENGYALRWRCAGYPYDIWFRRIDGWGNDTYTGQANIDQPTPHVVIEGKATGPIFNFFNDNAYIATTGFCQFLIQDIEETLKIYHIDTEHTDNYPGGLRIEDCNKVEIWTSKHENSYPSIYHARNNELIIHGVGGNHSSYMSDTILDAIATARGNWSSGYGTYEEMDWVIADDWPAYYLCKTQHASSTADSEPGVGADWALYWLWFPDIGFNKEPSNYPAGVEPALIVGEDSKRVRITCTQDLGRFDGYHGTYGSGCDPNRFYFFTEVESGVTTYTSPLGSRPVVYQKGELAYTPDDSWDAMITEGLDVPNGEYFLLTQGLGDDFFSGSTVYSTSAILRAQRATVIGNDDSPVPPSTYDPGYLITEGLSFGDDNSGYFLVTQGFALEASSGLVTGEGVLVAQPAYINGIGYRVAHDLGSDTVLVSTPAETEGTGSGVLVITGEGTLNAQRAKIVGSGTRKVIGTGTLAAQSSSVSGDGKLGHIGSGDLEAQSATIVGNGFAFAPGDIIGGGILQAQPAQVTGTGVRGVVATSAALAAGAATVEGSGSRVKTVTGTGVLIAQSAVTIGGNTGNVIGSGTLQAQRATVSGTAKRKVVGTGVLIARPSTTEALGYVFPLGEESWEQNDITWGGVQLGYGQAYPVYIKDFQFFQTDTDSKMQESFIEREGLAIASRGPRQKKLVKTIWPIIDGTEGTQIDISIGSQTRPDGAVTWSGPQVFTVGEDEYLDFFIETTWTAIRFASVDERKWSLTQYGIDYDVIGDH